MKALPAAEDDYVRRFVDSLCLGCRDFATVYREAVRSLLRFVRERSGHMDVSEEALIAWITKRRRHLALRKVAERARMADRFLEWMKTNGHISGNPFQALRSQYGGRLAPIIYALLNEAPQVALEKLRPSPVFASALGPLMRDHVTLMRSLGYRYDANEGSLRRFDRFLQGRPDLVDQPLTRQIDARRQTDPPHQRAHEAHKCGRTLSKAQARLDSNAPIIPTDRELWRRVKAAHRRPHIYTEEDIGKLLDTARNLPSRLSPLRTLSTYTMLLLTYCAGLRIQEVVNLNVGDVDLIDGTIEIRNSKFFKSRRLPLPPGVIAALQQYLQERHKAGAPTADDEGLFWHTQRNSRYSKRAAQELLSEVLRRTGMKTRRGKVGPRVHDLRHSMVSNRMLSWYREGINPQSHLAHLAAFMGHTDIQYTLAYITVTPELLQLASERFRQHAAHVLGNTGISS
jgi:site-specific recombinase XerD